MPEVNDAPAATIPAVLEGGPTDLPPTVRRLRVPADDQKVKIAHRGGYEHFERDTPPLPGDTAVVFYWTTRTKIAE
ncbi:MAG: hypothetical protein HOV87_22935 [Catenulispora sp.]|nr:hypothetical protein [Catenulispora sp.]